MTHSVLEVAGLCRPPIHVERRRREDEHLEEAALQPNGPVAVCEDRILASLRRGDQERG